MAEAHAHEVPRTPVSKEEPEGDSECRGSKLARPRSGRSTTSTEGMFEVKRGRYVDVRLTASEERFKDMVWGDKYEGRYRFLNVDQADEVIAFLTEKVEFLKVDIQGNDSDIDATIARYRNATHEYRSISMDIGKLQENLKVQGVIMENIKKDSMKLDERSAAYRERMCKY